MYELIHKSANRKDWSSKWIWNDDDGPANTWMCLRKSFTLDEVSHEAPAYISADSKYWLWVNGELAVFEGGLNRGPYPGSGYYDSINIGKLLKKGVNSIAALVWYWGNGGRNSVDSGKGGFLFLSHVDGIDIVSDNTWKVKVHPAYGRTGEPYPSYLYGGYNIGFDARADIPGWNKNGYDDSVWENASEKCVPPGGPWGELYERPIPMVKDYGLKNYNDVTSVSNDEVTVITANLPYAAHITPYFRIKTARGGLKIDVRTDRYEVNGGPGDNHHSYNSHRTEYTTKEGVQEFESLDWLFGEQVIYTIPNDVEVLELKYRETGYGTGFEGEFNSNDSFLNNLYEKCRRTLYICMRDNYMDCPDRERGQWIGDVSSQVPQTFYALGRSADYLTRKAVQDFINWKSGYVLRGNVPGAHAGELPPQSLNAISEHGMIMSYYMHSGDTNVLYETYEAAKEYLWLWNMDENGMVAPRMGDWYWFDHGINIDTRVLENAWYYSALKSAVQIAGLTGNIHDIPAFEERIASISKGFDRLFWKGEGYRSGDFYDDRANAMAVLSGLACKDKYPAILDVLKRIRNSTPYMEGYVLESLFMMGYGREALQRMKERYTPLVNNSNSTLWEDFSVLGTRNHAWSGGPLTLLAKYIAGVAPEIPGYGRYHVLPQLTDLTSLNIVVPSVKGNIEVDIHKDIESFRLSLVSPVGTSAVVGIPKYSGQGKIICNAQAVWENGMYMGDSRGISYYGSDKNYICFMVNPGRWDFTNDCK